MSVVIRRHPAFPLPRGTAHRVVYRTARTDLLELAERGYLRKEMRGKAFVFVPVDDLRERIEGKCHIAVPRSGALA